MTGEKQKRRTQADQVEPRGLNKKSAARYLGCGESGIDDLVSKGKLTAIRYLPNGRFSFSKRSEVE